MMSNWSIRIKKLNPFLNLSSKPLDPNWIERQVRKGRLKSGYIEVLTKIIPSLESIYPGRWDIQCKFETTEKFVVNQYYPMICSDFVHQQTFLGFETDERAEAYHYYNRSTRYLEYLTNVYTPLVSAGHYLCDKVYITQLYIVIYFPEVIVTNSNKESLVIKDLFVRVGINESGQLDYNLEGIRSTYSIPEMISGYIHSHLRSIKWSEDSYKFNRIAYRSFCLGASDLITFANLYNSSNNIADFESYLFMLNTVVSWESLQGGPHIKLSNTISKSKEVPDPSELDCRRAVRALIYNIRSYHCNIDWVFRNNRYYIVDNEKFEDLLRTPYQLSNPGSPTTVYKDNLGKYFVPSPSFLETKIKPGVLDFVPFKGQKFVLKVEGELKLVNNHKWYVNPKIKQYVKLELETALNKAEVKKSTIEWFNKISDNSTVLRQS